MNVVLTEPCRDLAKDVQQPSLNNPLALVFSGGVAQFGGAGRPASRTMLKNLSIVGYLGMVAGLLGLVMMRAIFSVSPLVISVQVAALLLAIWARVTFRRRSFHVAADPTEGGLVTSGPYHFIRHPIYTAICLTTVAGAAANWSWAAGAWGGLVIGGLALRMFCEEKLVTERYPEYRQYAASTWRMIPHVF